MRALDGVYLFALGFFALMRSECTTLESVWLEEVTTRSQADKRSHSDTNLPNELAFRLKRSSETLSLFLRRNYDINPKAAFYFVNKLKDGETALVKSPNLDTENVAYYQDIENGALVSVRCVQLSNAQCERVINGHLRIRDTAYELLPVANDDKSRNLLQITGGLGKQYILKNQSFSRRDTYAPYLNENDVKQEIKALLRRFQRPDKEHQLSSTKTTLSTRNISGFYDREATGAVRQLTDVYYVKVAVLIDSGLWEYFSSMVPEIKPLIKRRKTMAKLRQYFSYIMNGVNMLYKGIEDTSIIINIILTDFIVFKNKAFPHEESQVQTIDGVQYIKAHKYLKDFNKWDTNEGVKNPKVFDVGMLFTRYKMIYDSTDDKILGVSYKLEGEVCNPGKRGAIIEARGLFWTVFTAAHELGHILGAVHDGAIQAKDCSSKDNFIMSYCVTKINIISSSRNPWLFSNCSVKSFKETLKQRKCVLEKGDPYDIDEYTQHLQIEPGVAFNASEQCRLLIRRYSKLCETAPEDVCHAMRCTYPATGECMEKLHGAADGTECGHNKRCIRARCV